MTGIIAAFTWVGAGVAGAVGVTSAIGVALVGVAVTAVVGAAVGGLVAAVSGGDIGSGMLYGAVGAVVSVAAYGAVAGAGAAAGGTEGVGGAMSLEGTGMTTATGAARPGVAGAAIETTKGGGTVLGSLSLSDGAWLAGTTLVSEGVGSVLENQQMQDAADAAKREAELNRDWTSKENQLARDAAAANAELAASISSQDPPFYLDEKMALAEQQYAATAGLSEKESERRIAEYRAKLEGDEGVLSAGRERAAKGILGTDVGAVGEYVEGETINQQSADAGVGIYDEYREEATV